jgi:selenocysteine lyase/cysteine desulfurase
MSIASYRDELPAVTDEGWIHLDNCSAGPIPERGLEARRTCERVWIEAGNPGEEWLETVDEARGRFAELIHAEPKDVAVLSCSTDALSQVASAFDYGDRNEVVLSDLEFPSIPQFWAAQEQRGARRRWAESPDRQRVPTAEYERAISGDTLLVCSAHAYSFRGG